MAVATLYLVAQGCEVVEQGRRREVDPHWFRGSSYLKIGWQWLKHASQKGWQVVAQWQLVGGDDPDPAIASRTSQQCMPRSIELYPHYETTSYAM